MHRRLLTLKPTLVLEAAFRDVFIQGIPLINALSSFEMRVIYVIEPLVPCFNPPRFQLHYPSAEAAPEGTLTITANTTTTTSVAKFLFLLKMMVFAKMCLKEVSAIEELRTFVNLAGRVLFVTPPCLELIVLRVLVAFPVILAAKQLGTVAMCTAPGTAMTLLVLSSLC